MDTLKLSWPRKLRKVEARFKELLRIMDSFNRTVQMGTQAIRILVRTIGQVTLAVSPNIFNRIKFRSISGKTVDMKSLGLLQKCFNICPFMNRTTIPDQHHVPTQMAQQIPQEPNNFPAGNIMRMKPDIQAKTSAIRRDGKAPNGRNLFMTVTVSQDGCFSLRCPGLTNSRHKQKPALVKKRQVGTKFLGFFLFGATSCFSNGQWLFHLFAARVFPASGNSIQNYGVKVSRPLRAYSTLRRWCELVAQYVLGSIDRWYIRMRWLLVTEFFSTVLSADRLNGMAAPIWLGSGFPVALSCDRFGTNAQPNSRMPLPVPLRPEKICLKAAWQW